MSRAVTSGSTQIYAAGQKGNYNVLFDTTSTSTASHIVCVDNNFYRIEAFNLSGNEVITVEQVINAGQSNELITPYAPIAGPVTLTANRSSYIIERPGYYRFTLSGGGLGTVKAIGFQFAMENEASQDIVDALYAVLNKHFDPCDAGANTPSAPAVNNYINKEAGGCYRDSQLVSSDAGNYATLHSNGIYVPTPASVTPCGIGSVIPTGQPAVNNYLGLDGSNCAQDAQLVSSGSGNLLQLRSDGLYYGILPPVSSYYVSSSLGSDTNAGTIGAPFKTIQHAINSFPDGTLGNIYLYAGDTFPTYPTATSETINTLTALQSINAALQVSNRMLAFRPYNDPAITDILAWNLAHSTNYNPYIVQEINFPKVTITQSIPTDSASIVPIAFSIGTSGVVSFYGCNIISGQVGTASPTHYSGGFIGGEVFFTGGNIIYSDIPLLGGGGGTQQLSINNSILQDHVTPSTPPVFYEVATIQATIITISPIASGGVYLVTGMATYHYNGDNAETVLDVASLWSNIQIYNAAARSYRHVVSSIYISGGTLVANLGSPSTLGAGARSFVSDATQSLTVGLGNVVAGGGGNGVPVYSDGTNWRIG